jgi:hypothetical protein
VNTAKNLRVPSEVGTEFACDPHRTSSGHYSCNATVYCRPDTSHSEQATWPKDKPPCPVPIHNSTLLKFEFYRPSDGWSHPVKSSLFWDITPCNRLKINRCFGGTDFLQLQGPIRRARYQRERRCYFTLFIRPWRWRSVPPKRRLTFNGLFCYTVRGSGAAELYFPQIGLLTSLRFLNKVSSFSEFRVLRDPIGRKTDTEKSRAEFKLVDLLRPWHHEGTTVFGHQHVSYSSDFNSLKPDVHLNIESKRQTCPCTLIKHHALKTHGGVDAYIHVFLTSALVGGERLAWRPCIFAAGEIAPVPTG